MAELAPSPEAQARIEGELERRRTENLARYHEAAAPVLADLAAAGFPVGTIGELRSLGAKGRRAVPVLTHWLPRIEEQAVRDDIVGTLAARWAKAAAPTLIAEFRRLPKLPGDGHSGDDVNGPRWSIGNALAATANDDVYDDIVMLASDARYGRDREMVVLALGNMRNPGAVNVLIDQARDEQIAGHAVMALGQLKAHTARALIVEISQTHPKTRVRREARKALQKIDS